MLLLALAGVCADEQQQPAAAPGAAAGRTLSESLGDVATSIVIGTATRKPGR